MPIEVCRCQNLKVRGATWAVASRNLLTPAGTSLSKYRSLQQAQVIVNLTGTTLPGAARVQRQAVDLAAEA